VIGKSITGRGNSMGQSVFPAQSAPNKTQACPLGGSAFRRLSRDYLVKEVVRFRAKICNCSCLAVVP
jgi:hypothetical protein